MHDVAVPPPRAPQIAPSSHGVPPDSFAAAQALEEDLRAVVKGEVRFDRLSRALYGMDASNYRQIPIGLVVPLDEADVIAAVAVCRKHGAPILARGGGTSLAGQGCNAAVVLDFSKNLNAILELDPEKRFARVQPGIVLDTLRNAAEKHRLTFAPDPSTHNRCTLGGMIGNNSSGVHGLMAGKVQENVESMRVLLYDGTILEVGRTPAGELAEIVRGGGRRGEVYAGLLRLRDEFGELVRQRYAKIPRRVSGYNFDELLPETEFNVARALVGTEGTCAIILEATLRLVPSPQFKSLVCLGYADVYIAADAVPDILKFNPIGLEGFEGGVLDVMKQKGLQPENIALLPPGRGYLLVEFGGDTRPAADALADDFVTWIRAQPEQPHIKIVRDAGEVRRIWKVREAGNGSTTVIPGEHSITHEGWEDAAVHPRVLGPYLRDYRKLLEKYGYKAWYYGHFGEGCVHQRVTFDLESTAGIGKYREFLEEAADLVVRYGGAISGEHGDGHGRAHLYTKMFGPELVDAFRRFKTLWDPDGKLNPGKVVDAYPPEAHLKLGADYNPQQVVTHFKFPDDQGSFEKATQRCVGVGACRKTEGGIMCPSFQATREELHSTRGRAHVLWEMLQGEFLDRGWQDERVKESLDLCLSCKACKGECPVNVDIATYKSEFLSHYWEGRVRPLQHYAFGYMDKWSRLASYAPKLVNAVNASPLGGLAKKVLGVAHQRHLPKFAEQTFAHWLRGQPVPAAGSRGDVVLFADTWNNYFKPSTSRAAWELLTEAGWNVHVPQLDGHLCCGRPLYDFGLLDAAKKYLGRVLTALEGHVNAGRAVVMLEPSCASVFRDELRNLMPHHGIGHRLRKQTFTLSEFLVREGWEPPSLKGRRVVLHGHCHHKSVLKFADQETLLKKTGAELKSLDSGCCGMAGPFGFEEEKYEISQQLGERVLLPAARAAAPDDLLCVDGFSCREQIWQNLPASRPLHLAEILRAGQNGK